MIGRVVAGAAALGLVLNPPPQTSSPILLTVPQRDRERQWTDAPSAAVSGDGRYVAFASYARLTPADVDDRSDIYVLDRDSGRVTLESVSADGRSVGSDSARPGMSGDGRYLVFETTIARDGERRPAIVVRDRANDGIREIMPAVSPRPPPALSGTAAISEDGRVIVFASTAADPAADRDPNDGSSDVYLFELTTGSLRRVSVTNAGMRPSTGSSFAPSVSADGRYVAFASSADFDGDSQSRRAGAPRAPIRPLSHIYIRDTQLNLTTRVSVDARGAAGDGSSSHPVISLDGRFVAFVSEATNLVPGDRNRSADVLLYDIKAGSATLVSRGVRGGSANGASGLPSISADGGIVAFQSEASDLVCARQCSTIAEDINLVPDIFVFHRATGVIIRISEDATGGWMEPSVAPAIDAAGHVVTFTSRHPIDAEDDRNDFDLFVRVSPR